MIATGSARVACAQIAPVIAEPTTNAAIAQRAIRRSIDEGAHVIVLPELMNTGYHLTPSESVELAEDLNGLTVAAWVEALAGTTSVVVGGLCERAGDGRIQNSAVMVSADGLLAVYRKVHLWADEPGLFTPGEAQAPVVDTQWGPIALSICYDLFFPEWIRSVALRGAWLLAVPTNSPAGAPPTGRDDLGIGLTITRASAYQNRMFLAVCDRHGEERGHDWAGRSAIVDPEGRFVAGPSASTEALLLADCELSTAANKQWEDTKNNPFVDRRPALYEVLTAPRDRVNTP